MILHIFWKFDCRLYFICTIFLSNCCFLYLWERSIGYTVYKVTVFGPNVGKQGPEYAHFSLRGNLDMRKSTLEIIRIEILASILFKHCRKKILKKYKRPFFLIFFLSHVLFEVIRKIYRTSPTILKSSQKSLSIYCTWDLLRSMYKQNLQI